jgi:hypothetical protein
MKTTIEYGDEFEEVEKTRESLEKMPLWHKVS